MTPLKLNILLHYYTRATDFDGKENEPQTEWINHLVDGGILSENMARNPIYKITDKGIVYVQGILEAALSVPLPIYLIPKS